MKSPIPFLSAIVMALILTFGSTVSNLSAQQVAPAPKPPAQPAAPEANPAPASPAPVEEEAASEASRYKAWQMDQTLEARRTEIFNAFKAGTIDADRQGLEKFFDNYYFARWTRPENRGQVQVYMRDLIEKDFKDIPANAAREFLLDKSFRTLQKMAADVTITPTARYNALLAIGQLHQREAPGRNDKPVPYAQTLKYLVGEYENKDNPDFIRLGALLGIFRHSILGINADDETKNKIPALYIETIRTGAPKPDRPREEQQLIDWFRYRALEGLGALKSPGENGKIVDVLVAVIENSQESIDIRTRAARTLGELDFPTAVTAGTAINFQRLGTMLITLTKSACDFELQRIEDLRAKERAEQGGGGMPAMGMGMGMGMEQPMVIGAGGMNPQELGIPFAQLLPEKQLQVTEAVQRIKGGMTDILYGIRGPRPIGQTTIGVVPMLPGDDPITAKLNATARAMSKLFQMLDEGPPDLPVAPGMGMEEMGMGGGPPRTTAAKNKDEKQLKVNLTIIRDELQVFSRALNDIITGGG